MKLILLTMESVCLYQILPVEMIEAIIKSVRDTKTILSLRKVDRFFYSRLRTVPIYEYNKKIGYFGLNNTKFTMFMNNKLQREITFSKYGEYIYKEYHHGLAKIVESKPLKTKLRDYTNPRLIETTEYDILKSEKKTTSIPLMQCLIC